MIKELLLDRIELEEVEEGAFGGITCTDLNLSNNKLKKIPQFSGLFSRNSSTANYPELVSSPYYRPRYDTGVHINLSGNQIEEIPEGFLRGHSWPPIWIDLARNNIKELTTSTFADVGAIISLELSYNKIERVPYSLYRTNFYNDGGVYIRDNPLDLQTRLWTLSTMQAVMCPTCICGVCIFYPATKYFY